VRQLCFIIAILGDDPEDTLARAMVKRLLGQGVNVMTMSPAKGEGNHSYPLERVEKAIIMIAHRLKTVRHADQILVVDKGRIVQRGTHDELVQQDGIYRRFVQDRRQAASWKLQGFTGINRSFISK